MEGPTAALWNALLRVTRLRFDARGDTWTGTGHGTVTVEAPAPEVITFTEAGNWRAPSGTEFAFNNVFRWSLTGPEQVRLEHLRFGPDNPVVLFDVAPTDGGGWAPVSPHVCVKDCYDAELRVLADGVWVGWTVTGPKKRERIEYTYQW